MTSNIDLDALFKRLHLANSRRVWRHLCRQGETEQWTFEHFLEVLVAEEVAQRAKTRIERVSRKAELPFLKTIDEFDFTFQSTLRLQMMGSFLSPDFITDGRSLILSGKTGRGKTHLAVAIAYKAIQNGFDALFTTCTALVDELSAAAAHKGRFKDALDRFTRPNLLIVDEVGYLAYGNDAANVLFHVVNERYLKKRPMIFTTNKDLKTWGRVLHDEDLADVIIDRVLERGRHIKLDGPSKRTDKHPDLDNGRADDQNAARVSGTKPAEFPEPTSCALTVRWAALCASRQIRNLNPRSSMRPLWGASRSAETREALWPTAVVRWHSSTLIAREVENDEQHRSRRALQATACVTRSSNKGSQTALRTRWTSSRCKSATASHPFTSTRWKTDGDTPFHGQAVLGRYVQPLDLATVETPLTTLDARSAAARPNVQRPTYAIDEVELRGGVS